MTMREQTVRRILAACLLGLFGLAGCQLFTQSSAPPVPSLSLGTPGTVTWTALPEKALSTGTTVTVIDPKNEAKSEGPTLPPPTPLPPPSPPSPPSPPPEKPQEVPAKVTPLTDPVEELPKPFPAAPAIPVPPPPQVSAPSAPPAPIALPAPKQPTHAEDYTWLSGEVQKVATTRGPGWRLRYAGLDEEDGYGGSVLLVAESRLLEDLQDGQRVRVTGRLLNPEEHFAGTPFHVQTLTVEAE